MTMPRIGMMEFFSNSGTSTAVPDIDFTNEGNRLLLVALMTTLDGTITGVTYGGTPLTLVDSAENGTGATGRRVSVYRLLNPAVGRADVVASYSASLTATAIAPVCLYGVHQTSPLGPIAKTNGSGTGSSITPASDALDDLIFDALAVRTTSTPTPDSGQAGSRRISGTIAWLGISNKPSTREATVAMGWSWTGADNYAHMGFAIKPAAPRREPRAQSLIGV